MHRKVVLSPPPKFTKSFRRLIQFPSQPGFFFSVKKFLQEKKISQETELDADPLSFLPLSQAVHFVDIFNLRYPRYESGYDCEIDNIPG